MDNVIAFRPKRLEQEFVKTKGQLPQVILREVEGEVSVLGEYVLVGNGPREEVQAIHCGYDKLCAAIEILFNEASNKVKSGYNVLDQQRFVNMLNTIRTSELDTKQVIHGSW